MSDSPISVPLSELLLDRYLSGECTPEERQAVDQILNGHSVERDSLESFVSALHGMERPAMPAMEALRRLHARNASRDSSMEEPIGQRPASLLPLSLRRSPWSTLLNVGVAALLVMVGWIGATHARAKHLPAETEIYTTANGQRATITLADGNTVALNVASRLEVPADYLAGNHHLRLTGEALFTIQHHTGAPITVLAGQSTARVLGTIFVVRHYATDTITTVAVREGKVAVGTAVVTANRLVEVGSHNVARLTTSNGSAFTFASGILTLDNLPLPDAITELDRWYGADVRLGSSSLATEHLKGKFAAGSLNDLQEILELTYDVRVVRDGRILTLYPRR